MIIVKYRITFSVVAGDHTAEEYKSHVRSALEGEDYVKAVESKQEENR
jgi:hypothetical protein